MPTLPKLPPLVRKIIRGTLIAVAATPPVAAGAVMGVSAIKDRHLPYDQPFPHLPPQDDHIGTNATTIYTFGADLYRDMLAAINSAQREVLFESYIWRDDGVGTQFKDALNAAVERGVSVYVIYDLVGNRSSPREFYKLHPDAHVLRFPVLWHHQMISPIRTMGVDHRKILVVDDETAFVGGYNIGDLYSEKWRDTHIRVVGPAAWELKKAFVLFWNRWSRPHQPKLLTGNYFKWDPNIRATRNTPARISFPIRTLYLEAIERSTKNVYITQAYFIPDKDLRNALVTAAGRGVDVRVLIPDRSNHVLADWLACGHFGSLLRGGVRIFLFQDAMNHSKTATVDGCWSTIGTANVDALSFSGNYEINLEIFDVGVAKTLERVFAEDLTNCRELQLDEWAERHLIRKVTEHLIAPLAPLG